MRIDLFDTGGKMSDMAPSADKIGAANPTWSGPGASGDPGGVPDITSPDAPGATPGRDLPQGDSRPSLGGWAEDDKRGGGKL